MLASSPSGAFIQREQHAAQLSVRSNSGEGEPVIFQARSFGESYGSNGLGIFGSIESPLSHGSPFRKGPFAVGHQHNGLYDRDRDRRMHVDRDRDRGGMHGLHAHDDVDAEDDDLFGCAVSIAAELMCSRIATISL
jgi:hypothetical protein